MKLSIDSDSIMQAKPKSAIVGFLEILSKCWYILGSGLLQQEGTGGRHSHLSTRLPAQPACAPAHVSQEQAEQQETKWTHSLQWLSL